MQQQQHQCYNGHCDCIRLLHWPLATQSRGRDCEISPCDWARCLQIASPTVCPQMSSRGLAGKRGKWEMRDPLCCKLKDSWTKLNNLETLFTRDFHKFTSKGWIDSFNFDQFLPYFFHQQEPNEYAWSSSWCLLVLVVESHQVILCPSQLILDQ